MPAPLGDDEPQRWCRERAPEEEQCTDCGQSYELNDDLMTAAYSPVGVFLREDAPTLFAEHAFGDQVV